jgi:pimeloyl-ACP methyl ester carboxylesterase
MLIGAAAVLVLLYASVVALAYFAQTRMLFPVPPERRAMPAGGERLWLDADGGVRLAGVRIRGEAGTPVILAFGGNGWNAEDAAEFVHDILPASEIVAFHYRGFVPSGGTPRTRDLEADALRVYDLAARETRGRPVVAIGFSIGSGLAAHVAARRPLAGAILVTPFDSLTAVAAAQLPWLPVRLLFRNPMEPAAELRGTHVPVAMLAGGADSLVRPERTEALRKALPALAYDRTIAGAGHNDIYARPEFGEALREATAAVLRGHPAR